MRKMKSIDLEEEELLIVYEHEVGDEGVDTWMDGSPGYPSIEDRNEIIQVFWNGTDVTDLIFSMPSDVMETIKSLL